MAKLKGVFARVRLPIFSVKHPETFQVMSCLPIPQPSTLVGALAYCIGTHHGSGVKAFYRLKEVIEGNEVKLIARARLMGITIISPLVLRRFRIADEFHKRMQFYDILSRGDYYEGKIFLERALIDAFYRSYAMSHEILCAWIIDGKFEISDSIFYLLQRLGDTESLITVCEVWLEDVEINEAPEIRTSFPFPLGNATIRGGNFAIMKMCDEKRLVKQFVIPIKHEFRPTDIGKVMIIEPTEVEVVFPYSTTYCETSHGAIILPEVGGAHG
ncbi:MAG: type I-A CRISPR-associated protein Cas5a [Nitrososphaerota archaeon]